MKNIVILTIFSFIFLGCSYKQPSETTQYFAPKLKLEQTSFDELPLWSEQNFEKIFETFKKSCETKKTYKKYPQACDASSTCKGDKRKFFEKYFQPFTINDEEEGMLTGYYEPLLHGSRSKSDRYRYPIYKEPNDLIEVDLSSLYPELGKKRYKGRVVGKKLVPYYERKDMQQIDAEVICYVDNKIELFFLEVQGSGRVKLDSGEIIYVGYKNQNGHPYRSIGRYLIHTNKIPRESMSLQAIYEYLKTHPDEVDTVLNYNPSIVFFSENDSAATGALGVELTKHYSVAVDPKYIPLGSLLYLDSFDQHTQKELNNMVLAQDVGGAIKGAIRADMFFGYGKDAMQSAGLMKENLKLWMLLPKEDSYN